MIHDYPYGTNVGSLKVEERGRREGQKGLSLKRTRQATAGFEGEGRSHKRRHVGASESWKRQRNGFFHLVFRKTLDFNPVRTILDFSPPDL